MRRRRLKLAPVAAMGLLAALFTPIDEAQTAPPHRRSYQTKGTVETPRLFAEGIISTDENEVGGTFNADGTEFYFSRLGGYTTLARLGIMYVARYEGGRWKAPEVLPFSGRYLDYPPKFDSSGKRLLFASSRPFPDGSRGGIRIWEVERSGAGWGDPRPLPAPINAPGSFWNADPSQDNEGTLYFSSDRGGDGVHIYRSRREDGKYSEPEKLSAEINSEFNDTQPAISPDGKVLVFASVGADAAPYGHRLEELSTGGKPYPRGDLYVSVNRAGVWSQARHLDHGVNTWAEEDFPFLSPDGQYLFFSSERSPFSVPTAKRLRYEDLEKGLHSVLNGYGNIYYIDLKALKVTP